MINHRELIKCILKIDYVSGMWNPSMEKGRMYWLYQAYIVYFFSVIMVMRILTILVRALNTSNSTEFFQEFSLLVVLICDCAKGLTFIYHRSDVLEILEILNWERHNLGTEQVSEYTLQL